MNRFDNETALKMAEERLPLKRLIEQYGHAPANGNWSNYKCHFCTNPKNRHAHVFETNGIEMFACRSTNCLTGGKVMPAVQYLGIVTGLSNREAFKKYLKMAGVWHEAKRRESKAQKPETPRVKSLPAKHKIIVPDFSEREPDSTNLDGLPKLTGETPVPPSPEGIPGQTALLAFYERLALSPEDERKTFEKRGLATSTQVALGYRSNPQSNREILLSLRDTHSLDDLVASGLWLVPDQKRKKPLRPNAQFCGAGRLRKLKLGEKPGPNAWLDQDGNLWGWCEPVLIPYFDDTGALIGLRPHKGMAPGDTLAGSPRIYVPRNCGVNLPTETFQTVVITEGEFKAAALWRIVGAGREDGVKPVGVVALPGITFGKHFAVRMELEDWLRRVQCQSLTVAFDHEEKPAEAKGRFDSIIYACYLATDLHQKLHLNTKVCVLPAEWADENRKADWDGALAKLTNDNSPRRLSPSVC